MRWKFYTSAVTALIMIAAICSFLIIFFCTDAIKTLRSQGGRFEDEISRYELLSKATPPTSEQTFFVGSSNFALWDSGIEERLYLERNENGIFQ